jgi:hypothetical protein
MISRTLNSFLMALLLHWVVKKHELGCLNMDNYHFGEDGLGSWVLSLVFPA